MSNIVVHDVYRNLSNFDLAVASNAGAAASTSSVSSETWYVRLSFPGSVSSTGGVRYSIGPSPVVTSTGPGGTYLPANAIEITKIRPGERVSVISSDAGTPTVNITELSD